MQNDHTTSRPVLKVGVLGCGPIAQFAHFESCQKACNAELHSMCDAAPDLLLHMQQRWQPRKTFERYEHMLEDPELQAVIIATADAFHVPLALQAIAAGKHVLVEKPLSHSVEACRQLAKAARKQGLLVQVGHNKRFDPGIEYAQTFVAEKLGPLLAFKGWYGDNTHRYTATDNLQPLPLRSAHAIRPTVDPKADLPRYYLMAHGSHLLDTAVFLGGNIGSIQARFRQKWDACCWMILLEFVNGAIGQLELTIKLRGDWHEGFEVYGKEGSVFAKTFNPWYKKSSEVSCYHEPEQQYYRPLGADGFSYRRQLEHFAAVILEGKTPKGTSPEQALHLTQGMMAIQRSAASGKTVYLDDINSGAL